MNDNARTHLDTFISIDAFGDENAADFLPATIGGTNFALLKTIVNMFQGAGGDQMASIGEAAQQVEIKSTRRETMRAIMSKMALLARSMEYAIDGISDLFRMPRNRNDADLLAAARAFAAEAVSHEAQFIAYGMDATFIDDLKAAADNFDASLTSTAGAKTSKVEATAAVEDWVLQGMRARRILDGIVKIKYADNPAKLAAWESAKHIKKAPSAPKPPAPPTP